MTVEHQIKQLKQVLQNEWLDASLRQEVEAQIARLKTELNPAEAQEEIEPFFMNFVRREYRVLPEPQKSALTFEQFAAREGTRIQAEYFEKIKTDPLEGTTLWLLCDLAPSRFGEWQGPTPSEWRKQHGLP